MTAVRIPPLAGGQARIRLVYQDSQSLQVLGFDGAEWATAYEDLDLATEQVVELTPTADIATNDGSATCYLITATTTGQRGWSCCVQVPDSDTEVELVTLVGAAAIDPDDITAGLILSVDERAALDAATTPDADNPIATIDDLPANATPASAAATGASGQIRWDADYIYVCIATDMWKRVAIATW